jgi:membrane associated rhomboid family serine protease
MDDFCLCLPSWKSDDCSIPIPYFSPLIKSSSWIRSVSWLEILIALSIFLHLLYWLPIDRLASFLNRNFTSSWSGVVDQKKLHTLVTSSLFHHNIIQLAINLHAVYLFGPYLYQYLGFDLFAIHFVVVAALSSLVSLIYRYHSGLIYMRSSGLSAVIIAWRVYLLQAIGNSIGYSILPSYSNSNLHARMAEAVIYHLFVDYLLLGDLLDIGVHVGGLAAGLISFMWFQ